MTRAKRELDLIAPLKYYVTQQSRMGDRHVYGAKSRFLTKAVMACLEDRVWTKPAVDVARSCAPCGDFDQWTLPTDIFSSGDRG